MTFAKEKPILMSLLRILTPDEIDDLSRIYLSFFRRSLTGLLEERVDLEKKELGYDFKIIPPPVSKIKKLSKKLNIPPKIESKVTGGVVFILDEKEKFSEINKMQKKLSSNYQRVPKLSQKPSKGVLVNKKCS